MLERAFALFHQQNGARTLNFTRNLAMKVGRHSCHTSWKDLAAFRHKFLQQIRVLVINRFRRDINPAPGHNAICAAKI